MASKYSRNQAQIDQFNAQSKGVTLIIVSEDNEKIAKLLIEFRASNKKSQYWDEKWGWIRAETERRSRGALYICSDPYEFRNGLMEISVFFDKYDKKSVMSTLSWLSKEAILPVDTN